MDTKNYLHKIVTVKMDRPLGSRHPKHGFVYPVNYGYIPNTVSGDGEELDAYVLGPDTPLDTFTGRCVAIIHRTDDDDDKLVIVPNGTNITDETIEEKTKFQEQWFKHEIIRKTNSRTELIDLYDNRRNPVITIERGQPIPQVLNKIATHIWFMNTSGEFLLQQRVSTAHKFPNMWGQIGGGIQAGETSWECCIRECREEMGIIPQQKNATLIGTIKRPSDFVDIWFIQQNVDLKDINMQPTEVQNVKWANQTEINQMQQNGTFIPSIVPGFNMVLNYLTMLNKTK